mmetsp:Transcript_17794/g.58536  ORF Transcript_17794/g.58536 Transcript_17794/m.58536 type:complete len:589 (-) Transcript_17794:228-1994(-)
MRRLIFFLLLLLQARGAEDRTDSQDVAVTITRPEDGERVRGDVVPLEVSAMSSRRGSRVILYMDGREVYRTEERAVSLQMSQLQVGYHVMEVQLTEEDEAVAYDSVEFFYVGDGMLAPDLDDTEHVNILSNVTTIDDMERVAIQHYERGQLDLSEQSYVRLISAMSNAPGATMPRLLASLGRVLMAKKDYIGALQAYRDAIWHTPTHAESHACIAHLQRFLASSATYSRGDEVRLFEMHDKTSKRLEARAACPVKAIGTPHAPQLLKVGILTVASGRYASFVRSTVSSAESYLLRDIAELHYFVFTDSVSSVHEQLKDTRPWEDGRVHAVYRKHDGWPSASMKRAHSYLEHAELWGAMDYVFAVDVDVSFVSYVSQEILGETVGTLHADNAFYDGSEVVGRFQKAWSVNAEPGTMWRQHHGNAALVTRAVYEKREESTAGMRAGEGRHYFAGGFYGGRSQKVLEMLKELVKRTNQDLEEDIVAIFHDESQINRYWFDHPPQVKLSCSYLYPEPTPEACWSRDANTDDCVRDEGHPWLWSPWKPSQLDGKDVIWDKALWKSYRRFTIRCLNLSKNRYVKNLQEDKYRSA